MGTLKKYLRKISFTRKFGTCARLKIEIIIIIKRWRLQYTKEPAVFVATTFMVGYGKQLCRGCKKERVCDRLHTEEDVTCLLALPEKGGRYSLHSVWQKTSLS